MPSHVLICLFLDLPLSSHGGLVSVLRVLWYQKKISPAALCTLVSWALTLFQTSQEKSWQASSFPHCSIIGKGHTGKVSLFPMPPSCISTLQQSIWTSPLDTGTTEKKLPYLLKSGSSRCLLNTAKRDEAGSELCWYHSLHQSLSYFLMHGWAVLLLRSLAYGARLKDPKGYFLFFEWRVNFRF